MAPFTEFIHIELNQFVDLNNPMVPESAVWQRAFDALASQPGCVNVQWAHRLENLEWLVLKIGIHAGAVRSVSQLTHLNRLVKSGILCSSV